MAAHQSGSSGCCASISCSTGSICRTRRSKRRFMIRRRCGVLLASTSAASRCRMRRRFGVIVGLDRDVLDADMLLMVLVSDDGGHVELHAMQVELAAAAGNFPLH